MANLSLVIGNNQSLQLTVTKNGAPVDLTGIQRLTITLQRIGGAVCATWGIGSGVTIPSPTTGVAILAITPAMLAWATGYFQCSYSWTLVDALGNVTAGLDSGNVSLTPPP